LRNRTISAASTSAIRLRVTQNARGSSMPGYLYYRETQDDVEVRIDVPNLTIEKS